MVSSVILLYSWSSNLGLLHRPSVFIPLYPIGYEMQNDNLSSRINLACRRIERGHDMSHYTPAEGSRMHILSPEFQSELVNPKFLASSASLLGLLAKIKV